MSVGMGSLEGDLGMAQLRVELQSDGLRLTIYLSLIESAHPTQGLFKKGFYVLWIPKCKAQSFPRSCTHLSSLNISKCWAWARFGGVRPK